MIGCKLDVWRPFVDAPHCHRYRCRPQTVIKCLISAGTWSGGGAMMLLSLVGTLAERATPVCDLYFLLSAPTSQIAKITHLLKENKKRPERPMFGLERLQLPLAAPPPPSPISFSPTLPPSNHLVAIMRWGRMVSLTVL